jgi:hypothetical protein
VVLSCVYVLSSNLLIPITLVTLLVLGSAMELALSLEKLTNEKLLILHSVIHLHFFSDFSIMLLPLVNCLLLVFESAFNQNCLHLFFIRNIFTLFFD